jgi:hypothetical protein
MTTNTITTTSAMDSLIGAYRSHLFGRALPTPVAMTLYPRDRELLVQTGGGFDLADKLGNLLLWAYTLTEVTAKWTHTKCGRLHVKTTGRISNGVLVEVFSGGEFTDCLGLVPLKAGESEGVSLDELYALAGLLREAQHEREAA